MLRCQQVNIYCYEIVSEVNPTIMALSQHPDITHSTTGFTSSTMAAVCMATHGNTPPKEGSVYTVFLVGCF